jgi:hypothetical protein
MAQISYFGPYSWASAPGLGLPPGAEHSWSWGPNPQFEPGGNPQFERSVLVATAHPLPAFDFPTRDERRLTVTMIQSHLTPYPIHEHFVHVLVRNVGPQPVDWYWLSLSAINP